jgi:hypothetical protein
MVTWPLGLSRGSGRRPFTSLAGSSAEGRTSLFDQEANGLRRLIGLWNNQS